MHERQLTPLDRLLASANNALRTVATPAGRSVRFLAVIEFGVEYMFGRIGARAAPVWRGHGAQGIVGAGQQAVQRR